MITPKDIINRMVVPPLNRENQQQEDQAEPETPEQDNDHAETEEPTAVDREDANDAD